MMGAVMGYLVLGLFGFVLGFKLHEVISRPVLDEYDRMLKRDALRQLQELAQGNNTHSQVKTSMTADPLAVARPESM